VISLEWCYLLPTPDFLGLASFGVQSALQGETFPVAVQVFPGTDSRGTLGLPSVPNLTQS